MSHRSASADWPRSIVCGIVLASTLLVIGCHSHSRATQVTGGNAERGRMILAYYGCSACHTIPGVPGARANVGPSLEHIGARVYLAGELRNTPANMVSWLRHPQQLRPGSAMPELGVHTIDARDIAAFLYTLE